MLINTNGILGIESLDETLPNDTVCTITNTNVTMQILESAEVNIGQGNTIWGGVFQVGNTTFNEGQQVNFTLTLAGANAQFNIGAGGFFGLGAGVVRPNQGVDDDQSHVLANTLFNANLMVMNLFGGEFAHNRIFSSDDPRSSSMVFGSFSTLTVNFDTSDDINVFNSANFLTSGGGNFLVLTPGTEGNFGAMRMYVPTDAPDNIILAPYGSSIVALTRMFDGLLGSSILISEITDQTLAPINAFLALKTTDSTSVPGPSYGKSNAAPVDPERFRQELTFGLLGYVDRSYIGRQQFQDVIDAEGGTPGERRSRLYDLGAAYVQVQTSGTTPPGPVIDISQIFT
jgi:hypothetical protein